jgi:ubiquinone/menaquinone biosynthesis C-methylase UbiE
MSHRVCPWWLGYLLASPLRRLLDDPQEMLRAHVREGMHALDVGSGMGFFSLPLASMVGSSGKVVCVDLQEKMLRGLMKRAGKAGLSGTIDARLCRADSLGLDDLRGTIDFVLAYAVLHEVKDKGRLLREIRDTMKPTAKVLLVEPKAHVSQAEFASTLAAAQQTGFTVLSELSLPRSQARLLARGTIEDA